MDRDTFVGYIRNPETLGVESIDEIKELIGKYPYFQTAHILCVKNLSKVNSESLGAQMKISSIFVLNREKLYDLLKENKNKQIEVRDEVEQIQKNPEKEKSESLEPPKQVVGSENDPLHLIENQGLDKDESALNKDLDPVLTNPKTEYERENNIAEEREEEPTQYIQTVSSNNKDELKDIITKRMQELSGSAHPKEIEGSSVSRSEGVADQIMETIKKIKEEQAKKKGQEEGELDKKNMDYEAEALDILEIDNSEKIEIVQEKGMPTQLLETSEELLDFSEENGIKEEKQENKPYTTNFSSLLEYEKTEEGGEIIDLDLGNDIIGNFIKNNPRINPNKIEQVDEPKEIIDEGTKENEDLYTEALAKIQVAQKNYPKAIEIYEKLSLKYPEKNSYFASQIQKIKDNIK